MEKFNFYRKLWHLLGLVIPMVLYYDPFIGCCGLIYSTRAILFSCLLFFTFFLALVEFLRLNHESFNQLFWKFFGSLMKEKERNKITATLPYFFSNLFVIAFFPPEIAILSIAFLLVGDPSAAFFGYKYGKTRFKNGKSVVGVVAFMATSLFVGILLLILFSAGNSNSPYALFLGKNVNAAAVLIVMIGVISAGVSEFYSGQAWKGFLDDNLTIPVSSSILMSTVSVVFFKGIPGYHALFPIVDMYK